MTPSCAPRSRSWRVRARVSMPCDARRCRALAQVARRALARARQFDGAATARLLTTKPSTPRPRATPRPRGCTPSCRSAGRSWSRSARGTTGSVEDLLVAGHGGVEDHLAGRLALGAEGRSPRRRVPSSQGQHAASRPSSTPSACLPRSATTLPPTMVMHGGPASFQPWKGVLRLLERNRAGPRSTRALGSRIGHVGRRARGQRAPGQAEAAAPAPEVSRATSVVSGQTAPVAPAGPAETDSAVSSPMIPKAAWSNSHLLLLRRRAARGRWRCSRSCRRRAPRSSASTSARGAQRRAHLGVGVVARARPRR